MFVQRQPIPAITDLTQRWERTIRDDPSAPEALLGESTNLRLVRLRLFLALIIMFAIPILIAAPFIYGLTARSGTSLIVPTVGPHLDWRCSSAP